MSKVKPSACPRDRLPPFMKLPKASTRPSTFNTHSPLWRDCCIHTHPHTHTNETKLWRLNWVTEREMKWEEAQQLTLHTLWRISTLRRTEVIHSWKVDWNRMQNTRSVKLGIWDNWNRNLMKAQNQSPWHICFMTQVSCTKFGSGGRIGSYCSGLSSGLASSLSLDDLICFLMPSISSFWALCQMKMQIELRWKFIAYGQVESEVTEKMHKYFNVSIMPRITKSHSGKGIFFLFTSNQNLN